jgi:hypothetical protein
MRKKELLKERMKRAQGDVTAAEDELARMLREMEVLPRAEKTAISRVIEEAFTKLRSTKADLAQLEKLISAVRD